jgi:hypothetical protein
MTAREEFSDLPQWLIAGSKTATPGVLRPFGAAAEDLAIDFRMARRPELITDLLHLCYSNRDGSQLDRDLLLNMPVGLRIDLLMRLASLTDPRPFSWQLHCICAEENEFELTAGQIVSLGRDALKSETTFVILGENTVLVRRPTALDQMQWLTKSDEFESKAMLRAMLVSPSLEDLLAIGHTLESIALAIEQRMEAFDPLVGFQLSVRCPQCGAALDVSPDLTGAALDRLSRAQRSALEDVHRLASRYHWTENQILDLPQWRRQSYLELIEGGI